MSKIMQIAIDIHSLFHVIDFDAVFKEIWGPYVSRRHLHISSYEYQDPIDCTCN